MLNHRKDELDRAKFNQNVRFTTFYNSMYIKLIMYFTNIICLIELLSYIQINRIESVY